ncbi:unnamed protein product [Musa textilis]
MCSWISDTISDIVIIKGFIMNIFMRLIIFNEFMPLNLLSVVDTHLISIIVMLKEFKLIKVDFNLWLLETSYHNNTPPYLLNYSLKRKYLLISFFNIIQPIEHFNEEYTNFFSRVGYFADYNFLHNRYQVDPKSWWDVYGSSLPLFQALALK